MLIPLKYNILHLAAHWKSTATTAVTFGLVVATFVIILSLAQGIERSLRTTGNPLNVIIMRSGVQADSQSKISLDQFQIAQNAAGITRDASGAPLVAPEVLALVNKPRNSGKSSNIQVRGVHPNSFVLRPAVHVTSGRMPRPGMREIIVARPVANRFSGFELGASQRLGRGSFTVVGIFDAQGTAYDSEIWAHSKEVMEEFDEKAYSTVLVRAESPAAVAAIRAGINGDRRLKLDAKDERRYYAEQTTTAKPVRAFAAFLAAAMAIGACFAGMNTMYANVANRTREIGTLRILGYTPASVLISFLAESVCLALLGGAIGCAAALPMNGVATGTTNFDTLSELTFYFTVTPRLMFEGMLFAAAMGLLGGFPPAWSASRQTILSALRQL